jgi:hypothetical protein
LGTRPTETIATLIVLGIFRAVENQFERILCPPLSSLQTRDRVHGRQRVDRTHAGRRGRRPSLHRRALILPEPVRFHPNYPEIVKHRAAISAKQLLLTHLGREMLVNDCRDRRRERSSGHTASSAKPPSMLSPAVRSAPQAVLVPALLRDLGPKPKRKRDRPHKIRCQVAREREGVPPPVRTNRAAFRD